MGDGNKYRGERQRIEEQCEVRVREITRLRAYMFNIKS